MDKIGMVPDSLDPFDYESYFNNPTKLYATVSNIETGQAEYIRCEDIKKDIEYVRASASLPLLSRTVEINGKKYLDGGICDSIPLKKAEEMGFQKNIVILTRVKGYQKEPSKMASMIKYRYRSYPKFIEAAMNRHVVYNHSISYIEEEEAKGKCFVIRPSKLLPVSRLEKNVTKIKELYELGREDADHIYKQLFEFING